MKVLVLGGGGREHALAWKLRGSKRIREVWCAPGNGGIGRDVQLAPFSADTPEGIAAAIEFARRNAVDLTVVGPEAPLVLGVVDRFQAAGLRVFGPTKAAAQLEGSKCFTKEFLARHGIPTAKFRNFDDPEEARRALDGSSFPLVIKADGLAAGKGVVIAQDRRSAQESIERIMVERVFGDAGSRIVLEEFLAGRELTLIVITDGETVLPLETAQDYKTIFDGQRGPNTGGMGSYSPNLPLTDPLVQKVVESILAPTLEGLRRDGTPFRGALYAGIMLTRDGPQLLEYNVRFGDPEIQSILLRLRTDLADVLEACLEGRLSRIRLDWDPRPAVCVVAASRGYPGTFDKGHPITGLDAAERPSRGLSPESADLKVFVAGARARGPGEPLETSGGRVLGVTVLGRDRADARRRAYDAMGRIHFEGMHYRRDIALD
jgi:phosphoribosylamine--glycine ligase